MSTGSLHRFQLKPVMQPGLLDRKACHRHGSRGSSDCEKDMKILCVPHLDEDDTENTTGSQLSLHSQRTS